MTNLRQETERREVDLVEEKLLKPSIKKPKYQTISTQTEEHVKQIQSQETQTENYMTKTSMTEKEYHRNKRHNNNKQAETSAYSSENSHIYNCSSGKYIRRDRSGSLVKCKASMLQEVRLCQYPNYPVNGAYQYPYPNSYQTINQTGQHYLGLPQVTRTHSTLV